MLVKNGWKGAPRSLKEVTYLGELVVAGGGLAGVCTAITAARNGVKTILVQDRPVLGGNASSEVRLWILGATSHMGNNNRYAREGGIVDEILIENLYRNPQGNPLILDTILLEKVVNESNITLLLNTAIFDIAMQSDREIEYIKAFCAQNGTQYQLKAPLFVDATGDGIVGFLAGAAFRMGAEEKDEFGELFAPDDGYGHLLGHSLYFYSKRVPQPVHYIPPAFALQDIKEIPRFKVINKNDSGCRLWWIEYGGRLDTVHDTETIKWELWKIIYGVWDYIKNSGKFEDVDNLTLEWVGHIPGKRESRRFEGRYMLKQQDLVEQRIFHDTVAYGGWAMDLHPADGVYSALPGCTQWHTKGIYSIPYRCYVSKDISNLFFAGRNISVTHVAFGSTRVMATCGFGGQAVGMAAALCKQYACKPADICAPDKMNELQQALISRGHFLPGIAMQAAYNKASTALINANSTLQLTHLPADGSWYPLTFSVAQVLPVQPGVHYKFSTTLQAAAATHLTIQIRASSKAHNYTPEVILRSFSVDVLEGKQEINFDYLNTLEQEQYIYVVFLKNENIQLAQSAHRITGLLTVFNHQNKAVSNYGSQNPPVGIGIDSFEFWVPMRRPAGKNLALQISPAIDCFSAANVANGFIRPWISSNAWIASLQEKQPTIVMEWEQPVSFSEIKIFLDTDYDHALESVLMEHPERTIPFCIRDLIIKDDKGAILFDCFDNYKSIIHVQFPRKMNAGKLIFECRHPADNIPAAIYAIVVL